MKTDARRGASNRHTGRLPCPWGRWIAIDEVTCLPSAANKIAVINPAGPLPRINTSDTAAFIPSVSDEVRR